MNYLSKPRFNRHQTVSFIGGVGKIKSFEKQDNSWTYTIEMNMGVKPDFGRVGAETTIVLEEQDIRQVNSNFNQGQSVSNPIDKSILEQSSYNHYS